METEQGQPNQITGANAGDHVTWRCGRAGPPASLSSGVRRIDDATARGDDATMNIAQIEEAVHRGVPFRLKVADGDEYRVPHADYIFLPPRSSAKRTYVIVHNDEGFASVLPLLTITSLTFQIDANA